MQPTNNELTAQKLSLEEAVFTVLPTKISHLAQNMPSEIIGQDRAVTALELGLGIQGEGYNIFLTGVPGTGRHSILSSLLKKYKPNATQLQDIAYVYNYRNEAKPAVLFFPAGKGKSFKAALKKAVESIYLQAQEIDKSETFLSAQKKIISTTDGKENTLFAEFEIKMLKRGFKVLQIKEDPNQSIDLIPFIKGKEVSFAELQTKVAQKKMSEKALNDLREIYYSSLDELADLFALLRRNRQEAEEARTALYTELLTPIIQSELIIPKELIAAYPDNTEKQHTDNKKIAAFLKNTEEDLIDRTESYVQPFKSVRHKKTFFDRYTINLICDNTKETACIVHENLPTFSNIFGTIEPANDDDELLINKHMYIKGGSAHRALGGYLVLHLNDLFEEEDSWVYLKRVLQSGTLEIQSAPSDTHQPPPFKPETIPAHLKVIIIGGEHTYEMLYNEDPDFYKLFKVCAEFDSVMPFNEQNTGSVLALIRKFEKKHKSRPLSDCGYARLIEYAVQLSGSRHLISTQFSKLSDVVAEANYTAAQQNSSRVTAEMIQQTLDRRQYLAGLPEAKFTDMVRRKDILIETSGTAIGKLNGLAVEERALHIFGIPVSITAQASAGTDGIINIEREAGLSGEIYDKAHFIITSLLRQKYTSLNGGKPAEIPLALSAAICFEQSYGIVDGDSASCAEFFALLSAIGNIPLRQDIAVTGSLNQHGTVQPVGGISEKITGFFDICAINPLTGTQGVLIPESNKNNLFLP